MTLVGSDFSNNPSNRLPHILSPVPHLEQHIQPYALGCIYLYSAEAFFAALFGSLGIWPVHQNWKLGISWLPPSSALYWLNSGELSFARGIATTYYSQECLFVGKGFRFPAAKRIQAQLLMNLNCEQKSHTQHLW